VFDFVPVSQLISAGTALVANPKVGPGTFRDFVAEAKKAPGKFNVAVAGANGQVATEVLKHATGIVLNNVPYKGSSPSEFALISGEVEVALLSIPVVVPYIKAGRMKAYGVTTARRSPMLPEVPTIAEQGVEGYEFGNWHSLFAPRGTADQHVRVLHRAVVTSSASSRSRSCAISSPRAAARSSPARRRSSPRCSGATSPATGRSWRKRAYSLSSERREA
jgi:tripartite-type tricarboxylate transporter receptor subunit TctC